jgi:hypothetical protein
MRAIIGLVGIILLAAVPFASHVNASDWPQFRGPNCSGRAATDARLPDKIGPSTNVLWKTALPQGTVFTVLAAGSIGAHFDSTPPNMKPTYGPGSVTLTQN